MMFLLPFTVSQHELLGKLEVEVTSPSLVHPGRIWTCLYLGFFLLLSYCMLTATLGRFDHSSSSSNVVFVVRW